MAGTAKKMCRVCGRRIDWRKKWERSWDQVRYCSRACRKAGLGRVDAALEDAIMALLDERPATGSICPGEAARRVAADAGKNDWRRLMEPARRAARRLAGDGRIRILQNGQPVDPSDFRGPVRLKRR